LTKEIVYLGLGSNLGDRFALVKTACVAIANITNVQLLKTSPLYITTPVSDIPQGDYINGVCKLQTTLSIYELFAQLKKIESSLGRTDKPKNAPRLIDIDILFFGTQHHLSDDLIIPHPRWKERLFVLVPLMDLTDTITYPVNGSLETLNLKEFLKSFPNLHNERLFPLNKTL